MTRISQIEAFAAVVQEGSFTAASERLDVSKSHVSNLVSELEERLGVRLLHRTTRSVEPTPEGEAYCERVTRILDDLEEADRSLRQARSEPIGELRVTAPVSVGASYLGELVGEFVGRHEKLTATVDLSDRKVDMVDEGFDVAIRAGVLEDSSLIVRKIVDFDVFVCAAPRYLERRGRPEHPEELADHDCLVYSYLPTEKTWRFTGPEEIDAHIEGPIESNNGTVLADAATWGAGLIMAPEFITAPYLEEGSLVAVLEDWALESGALWALYPHRRHLSAKVRKFTDFLQEKFDPPPWYRGEE
jgi:DNA-binding transcriptional LysR family regulator